MNRFPRPTWWSLVLGAWFASATVAQPAPEFTDVRRAAGGLVLSWASPEPGQARTVQVRDSLSGGPWLIPRAAAPWPVTATEWLDPEALVLPQRFYRVLAVPAAERGRLLSATVQTNYSVFQINLILLFAQVPLTAEYGVQVHKVTYETVDPWGGRTIASGAVVLPQGATRALPLLSYQHGTIAKRTEAPSSPAAQEQLLGVAFASFGYAAALPDYLGLGESPGVHPYHHAASEATACVDLLRAARALCADRQVALNEQVFLLGYSHGGHATAALQRELEEYHSEEFTVTASAPMAGAYDLSGATADDVLSGRSLPNPYYFALLLASYQHVYRLADSLADLLAPPYNATLPPLLDGQHDGGEINAAMPSDVLRALKPAYLEAFRADPDHPLRVALRDNDLYRWAPRAPTRLYHCRGDRDVIFANSEVAADAFHSRGATQVQLIDPAPSADHGGCTMPAFVLAKQWFDTLKR